MKRMLMLTVMAGTMAVALSAMACDRFPSFRPSNGYGYSSRYAPRYGQGYTWPRTYATTPVFVEEIPVVVRRPAFRPPVRPIAKPPVDGLPPAGPDLNAGLPLPPEDLTGPTTVAKKLPGTPAKTPADLPDLPLPPNGDAVTAPATPVVPNPMDEQIAPQNPVVIQQN